MNLRFGLGLMTCAVLVAFLGAQDDPVKKEPPANEKDAAKKKRDDLPKIKELEKKDAGQGTAAGDDGLRVRKIVERLHKNMDRSEEQLNKKDPGEETRKIQDDIIKDLDELIKQPNQGGGGGGGGQDNSASSSSDSKAGSSGTAKSAAKSVRKSKKTGQANNDKNDASGNRAPDKLGKGEDRKNGADPIGEGGGGKEGKGGDGMGGKANTDDNKVKNTIADLFKDVWGHLPQKERQEMDAYAKERFLKKYEEILRQYYRTISEQDRRKERD